MRDGGLREDQVSVKWDTPPGFVVHTVGVRLSEVHQPHATAQSHLADGSTAPQTMPPPVSSYAFTPITLAGVTSATITGLAAGRAHEVVLLSSPVRGAGRDGQHIDEGADALASPITAQSDPIILRTASAGYHNGQVSAALPARLFSACL